jgi:uncharacterized protein (DUF983 family)
LLHIDALDLRFSELRLARDPQCPGCGKQVVFEGYTNLMETCSRRG